MHKARRAGTPRSSPPAPLGHPRRDEKHYRQLGHRLGAPLIREVLATFRRNELSAAAAALGLGRTRFYEL